MAANPSLVNDGGTPQLCHCFSMPRTQGFQCQMEQLTLKEPSFFFTSNKVFPNKSPFIVMPLSSHAEVLKHLGPGHCLLNLTGPSAIAFQQYELCLSFPRPALHFPFKIGLIYHHPNPPKISLFFFIFHKVWQKWHGRALSPAGSSSRGNTRRTLAGNLLNVSPRRTWKADPVMQKGKTSTTEKERTVLPTNTKQSPSVPTKCIWMENSLLTPRVGTECSTQAFARR